METLSKEKALEALRNAPLSPASRMIATLALDTVIITDTAAYEARIAELEARLKRYEGRTLIDRDALLERAKDLDTYAWTDFASIVAEQPVIK